MRYLTFLHRRPVPVVSVYALILLYGGAAARKIPIELLPVLPLPGITVVTEVDGLSPEETETMVTAPLERGFLELPGLERMSSLSEEGVSTISLEFALGTESSLCFAETSEAAGEVHARLPDGASKPILSNTSRTEEGPLLRAAVEPRGIPFEELAAAAGGILTGRLLHIPEIGRVEISGALIPRIEVGIDSELLSAAGIPLSMISEVLQGNLGEYFLGTVENRTKERSLRLTGGISSSADIMSLPIPSPEGRYTGLTLGDVAAVTDEYAVGGSWAYRNGKPFLGIAVYRNPAVPTLEAAGAVRKVFAALEEEYPYLALSLIEDGSAHLRAAVRDMCTAVLMSTLSTLLVLSIFYSSLRAGLIILASLPCSLAPTILTLHLLGRGLNTVSLAGIVMGIGLIVDCSILVFHRSLPAAGGKGTLGSLIPSLTASTATSALVFIPVLFLPGITSALFRDLALTVTLLLLYSLAAAVVLIPTLINLVPGSLRPYPVRRRCLRFEEGYLKTLKRVGDRFVLPGLPLVLLSAAACVILLPKLPLPADRHASYLIRGEFSPGRSAGENRRSGELISRRLTALPGGPDVHVEGEGCSLRCLLIFPGKERLPVPPLGEVRKFIAAALPGEGVARYTAGPPPSPLSPFFTTSEEREYLLLADTRETISSRVGPICAGLVESGLCESAEYGGGITRFRPSFVLDPTLVRLSGSDPGEVSRTVSLKYDTKTVGVLDTPSGPVEVRCTAAPGRAGGLSPVVLTPSGTLPLTSVGYSRDIPSAGRLERFLGSPAVEIRIRSSAPGRRIEAFISRTGGDIEPVSRDAHLTKSIRNVFRALALSLLLIFFYLVLHYNGFRLPLLLTAFLPISASGSLFFLAVFGRSINIGSVLGILITLGTSLNTMILTAEGISGGRPEAVLDSAAERAYPLAATVATTVCAAVPGMLLCEYAFQRDTAAAVAGGILLGSILLMMGFPRVLYGRSHRRRLTS